MADAGLISVSQMVALMQLVLNVWQMESWEYAVSPLPDILVWRHALCSFVANPMCQVSR